MEFARTLKEFRKVIGGQGLYTLDPASFDSAAFPVDIDFTLDDEGTYYSPKDAEGLPQRTYASVGTQYTPTRMAAYALANFTRWKKRGDQAAGEKFRRCADWFANVPDGLFRYSFPWESMPSGWISGMAQGEAISVLTRACLAYGDDRYRQQALRAVRPFDLPASEGGVLTRVNGTHDFAEEYPTDPPRHTLNGFLYALFGLIDLLALTNNPRDRERLERFTRSLEAILPRYDLGFWSTYDLHETRGHRNPATIDYHSLHVAQLGYLARKLRSDVLQRTCDRWQGYQHSPVNRCRALIAKLRYRRVERPQR